MSEFRDRLTFDAGRGEYRDGATRYLMIRPDSLMGVLHELPAELRPDVLAAFARSVTDHGGKSAARYQQAGGDLLDSILRTAPALGWGVWSVNGDWQASVTNSPFAAGYGISGQPVCAPIAGMLTAVARLLSREMVEVVETECAAVTGGEVCRFALRFGTQIDTDKH